MFYSETLLSKTGPLAKVWLAANMEKKLPKTQVLGISIMEKIENMVTPNQAPMALRLSGQLLFGFVKLYKKKAEYLLEDCNDAILKIKMVWPHHLKWLSRC
jgi:cohesin complex subunit SCC1